MALRANILPLPSTTISNLATFDERDYEFVDFEEEQEVLLALGNVDKRDDSQLRGRVRVTDHAGAVVVVKGTFSLQSLSMIGSTLP